MNWQNRHYNAAPNQGQHGYSDQYSNFRPASDQRQSGQYFTDRFHFNPMAQEFIPESTQNLSHANNSNSRLNNWRVFDSSDSREVGDSLRDRLDEQLRNETYECMICCEKVRRRDQIWSCPQCYHVFHLKCVVKWAKASQIDQQQGPSAQRNIENSEGWRCPGCQYVTQHIVYLQYTCFCGRENLSHYSSGPGVRQPVGAAAGFGAPHACGQSCIRRRKPPCHHPCTLPCHPGPCPPCPQTVIRSCVCGSVSKPVRCGAEQFQCGGVCGKMLNCGLHRCAVVCHGGPCEECKEIVEETCFCSKNKRQSPCTLETTRNKRLFACGFACGKRLSCNNHNCTSDCHPGPCSDCPLSPDTLKFCPCGKTPLDQLLAQPRNSCTDFWPSCQKSCDKPLNCGPANEKHACVAKCHESSQCPPCPQQSSVRCRCGAFNGEVPCAQLASIDETHPYLCDKRCGKKKSCKVHKCTATCCSDPDHLCMQICGRKLTCGVHNCSQLCHTGKCRPCDVVSFDELGCLCGASVIYPPIRCGTKPPQCQKICSRSHSCDHPVNHPCHSEPSCPPCVVLTQKMCYGGHELRRNIPCYLDDVFCGKPCAKPLSCGQHVCSRMCHKGDCATVTQNNVEVPTPCLQPCPKPRSFCGHPCGAPCHQNSNCPSSICRSNVTITCSCGRIKTNAKCFDVNKHLNGDNPETSKAKCLPCDDDCTRLERNRRLAEALKIDRSPDDLSDLTPLYTECLKTGYRNHSDFVLNLEKIFNEMIDALDAPKGNQTTKSHVFPPMNRSQRQLIHEYAAFYNIETVSYDVEPMRNVVVTARKGKSKIPYVLLSAAMMKECKPTTILQRVTAPTSLNTQRTSPVNLVDEMTNLSINGTVPIRRNIAQ